MTDEAIAVAQASYEAYVAKDRAAIERLIADKFSFTSPLDNGLDRATYFERCWPNSRTIEGFDIIHLVAAEGRVFITYEGRTKDRRFRNTEIMTIANGQIHAVEVYFGWSIPHAAEAGGFVDEGKAAAKHP